MICSKILNIAASCVKFAQKLIGWESLPENNFGFVLKTKWLPYLPYWNVKTTFWKLWSANLLQGSNLTFDPCFKVMWCHHAKGTLYLPYMPRPHFGLP